MVVVVVNTKSAQKIVEQGNKAKCVCVCVYICIYKYIYTQTHTHTHTQGWQAHYSKMTPIYWVNVCTSYIWYMFEEHYEFELYIIK